MKTAFSILLILAMLCIDNAGAAQKYALLIGVTKYDHARMNSSALKYPEDDAEAVADLLRRGGYTVEVLLGKDATKSAIETALAKFSEEGNSDGVVLIGMFGHGVQYGQDAYFGPFDTTTRVVKDSAGNSLRDGKGQLMLEPAPDSMVSMRSFLDAMTLSKAKNKIMLADCCREDPSAARGRNAFGSDLTTADLPEGTAALFACSRDERAFEHDDWKHGAFTWAFLEQAAVIAAQGSVKAGRLAESVEETVQAMVAEKTHGKSRQTVTYINSGIVDLQLQPARAAKQSSAQAKMIPMPPRTGNSVDLELSDTAGDWFASTLESCRIGDTPEGWGCPLNTFCVAEQQDSRRLSYAGNRIAFLNLPAALMPSLTSDFVLEFDVTLTGNELEMVFQHKAATRRLRIFEDRGWHIAGASSPEGSVLFSREQPSTVRLERRSNQIKLFLLDLNNGRKPVFIRQFAWNTGITSLRLGLATGYPERPASITGLRIAAQAKAVDSSDAENFIEETFLGIHDGEVPDLWTASPALAVAVSTSATQPFVSKFTTNDAAVTLPQKWSQSIQGDYLLEADFAVFGGGSFDPSSRVELLFSAGKQIARIPCYTYRGKLLAGEASGPDGTNFHDFLSPKSYATIRIIRNQERFQMGMIPLNGDDMVVYSQIPANPAKIDKLSLGFSGGSDSNSSARVYAIRVESLSPVSQ